jgi:hypothetical protein
LSLDAVGPLALGVDLEAGAALESSIPVEYVLNDEMSSARRLPSDLDETNAAGSSEAMEGRRSCRCEEDRARREPVICRRRDVILDA